MSRDFRSQDNRGGQSPPQNQALNDYKRLIREKNFNHDDVMKLSEQLGKSLCHNPNARFGEGKDVSKTQIRKFYNLVRVAENNAKSAGSNNEMLKVKLRILQAQIAYAVARKTISDDFKEFFDVSLNKVIESANLKDSLGQFATFFEAFYAYFYYFTEVRRG